ncbi:MAG TPA: DUF4333 domain-containing protein [Amycolatopsis sp.]|uniref:DUF4333 domain-containing protein n=1 Tax=Amycolatopsis sp. TaxID=37632 RepID=UPI002B480731|nr:DUF4333 domain-containing protein [Amycolatopsis sp.]HKS49396.1 DUF4333 domain-containing protein [Amycolatopsis sp.]
MTQPPSQQPGWWPPTGPRQAAGSQPHPAGPPPPWQTPAPQWQQPGAWQPPPGGGVWGSHPRTAEPASVYRGFDAFGGGKRKRSGKPWIIGAVVLVVLAGGGVAAWRSGVFSGDTLDQRSIQDGVVKVLREDFGESDVRNVQCPSRQPVKTGITFECSALVGGQPKKVTIRVLNEQAQFEVGAPR